jgi:hypothetical protein
VACVQVVQVHHVANTTPYASPTQERPDAVLPTMGGQTALNLAKALSEVNTMWCSINHCAAGTASCKSGPES